MQQTKINSIELIKSFLQFTPMHLKHFTAHVLLGKD